MEIDFANFYSPRREKRFGMEIIMNNEDKNKLVVDGYIFASTAEADLARSEIVKIKKINNDFKKKNPNDMLELYNKLIEKNIFKTIIGYNYLHQLRKILRKSSLIDDENIKDIQLVTGSAIERNTKKGRDKVLFEKNNSLREKIKCSLFVNVVLIFVIIVMFIISYKSKKFDVTAYEQQIQDKYSAWEESLNERESKLDETTKQ